MTNWYIKKGRPQIQNSFYKLFVKNKKIALERLINLLEEYRSKMDFCNKHENEKKQFLDHITEPNNFNEFLKFITEKTGVKFSKRPHRKRRRSQSYDEWWNERNLDGSFAYNGVTDDF